MMILKSFLGFFFLPKSIQNSKKIKITLKGKILKKKDQKFQNFQLLKRFVPMAKWRQRKVCNYHDSGSICEPSFLDGSMDRAGLAI